MKIKLILILLLFLQNVEILNKSGDSLPHGIYRNRPDSFGELNNAPDFYTNTNLNATYEYYKYAIGTHKHPYNIPKHISIKSILREHNLEGITRKSDFYKLNKNTSFKKRDKYIFNDVLVPLMHSIPEDNPIDTCSNDFLSNVSHENVDESEIINIENITNIYTNCNNNKMQNLESSSSQSLILQSNFTDMVLDNNIPLPDFTAYKPQLENTYNFQSSNLFNKSNFNIKPVIAKHNRTRLPKSQILENTVK